MYEGNQIDTSNQDQQETIDIQQEEPMILDDICIEELAIDGICGVY